MDTISSQQPRRSDSSASTKTTRRNAVGITPTRLKLPVIQSPLRPTLPQTVSKQQASHSEPVADRPRLQVPARPVVARVQAIERDSRVGAELVHPALPVPARQQRPALPVLAPPASQSAVHSAPLTPPTQPVPPTSKSLTPPARTILPSHTSLPVPPASSAFSHLLPTLLPPPAQRPAANWNFQIPERNDWLDRLPAPAAPIRYSDL